VSSAVDGLLADPAVRDRAAAASARLRQRPGTVRAADLIERLAVTREPVMR
jgi:UDP:flavonoid glycosyltransferase YjiC (YdhE family)